MNIQFATIDTHGIYSGMVDGIPATPPDVGVYAPQGMAVADTPPPTDEPGKWKHTNGTWEEYTQIGRAHV